MEVMEWLSGPNGGAVAMGFGFGFVGGYGFAQRTVINEAKARIETLEERLLKAEKEIRSLLGGGGLKND